MTATEILRHMLDERGVEYEGGERSLRWRDRYGIMMQAFPLANGELGMGVWSCTPEQAIAATLGRGTLTADDVRDLIERHSDATGGNGRDFHNGAYVAIADELNATLNSCNCSNNCTNSERTGTCRFKTIERFIDARSSRADMCECDRCGYRCARGFIQDERFRYCPNCGCRIVDPTTNDVDAEVDA